MVAERDAIGARIEQAGEVVLRDAEAVRGVLAIDDHEVEFVALDQTRQRARDDGAARLADDVTEEEKTHAQVVPVKGAAR